jgi:hypothetical protein
VREIVIIACGSAKIWDKDRWHGPSEARAAYTGSPFKINRGYAAATGFPWYILSAKYGFIPPEFIIAEPYNVSFNDKRTNPIQLSALQKQAADLGLLNFDKVTVLAGKEYRKIVEEIFPRETLNFPFAGLRLGVGLQRVKQATAAMIVGRSRQANGPNSC